MVSYAFEKQDGEIVTPLSLSTLQAMLLPIIVHLSRNSFPELRLPLHSLSLILRYDLSTVAATYAMQVPPGYEWPVSVNPDPHSMRTSATTSSQSIGKHVKVSIYQYNRELPAYIYLPILILIPIIASNQILSAAGPVIVSNPLVGSS